MSLRFVKSCNPGRGFILLSVSWCILILALLLASRLWREEIRFTAERGARVDQDLRLAVHSAEAMTQAAMAADVAETETNYDAPSDGWGWKRLQDQFGKDLGEAYPDVTLDVSIEDEAGKLNPTNAPPERTGMLLEGLGWQETQAREMTEKITQLFKNVGPTSDQPGAQTAAASPQSQQYIDLRCLLAIPGMSGAMLTGEDLNFNNKLDPEENDGPESLPLDNRNGALDAGLLRYLSLLGDGKVNPNMAPLEILLTVPGISKKVATEIITRRMGADGLAGTDDDFVFKSTADIKTLGSISKFLELEFRKMTPYLRMTTGIFQIRICAASKRTGQLLRRQTVVRRDKKGIRVIAQLEDNGY